MKISILTDNKRSWYFEFGNILNTRFQELGHDSIYTFEKEMVREGDVCFLLSCTKILPEKYLNRNTHNIVIHASDLPKGKGFSPLQWQIIEGKSCIVLTLFEAIKDLDAGDYFIKENLGFEGHELLDELHYKLGLKINNMAENFINNYNFIKPTKQFGESTFYPKRTKLDDKIDPNKSIIELFNHLRIANNTDYPLYFEHLGYEYNLKIEKRHD
jgi:methionyl-tRNA formyltransferase